MNIAEIESRIKEMVVERLFLKVAPEEANIPTAITGAKRDIVLMNAGAGLFIAGKAESMKDGVRLAAELIDSGKALEKIKEMIEVSNG